MSKSLITGISCALVGLVLLPAAGCRSCCHHGRHAVATSEVAVAAPVQTASAPAGKTFASAEEAMKAVGETAGARDAAKLDEIFGPGATDVLWSSDEAGD